MTRSRIQRVLDRRRDAEDNIVEAVYLQPRPGQGRHLVETAHGEVEVTGPQTYQPGTPVLLARPSKVGSPSVIVSGPPPGRASAAAYARAVEYPGEPLPELSGPTFYALAWLGGESWAIEQYSFAGVYLGRAATAELPGYGGWDAGNDSALLIPVDSAGLVSAETAVVTGAAGSTYGLWSWDWRATAVNSFVLEYIGDGLFRPQVGFAGGWLHWQALMDRPTGVAADLIHGIRARGDLSALSESGPVGNWIITGDVEDAPFGMGFGWASATRFRYRLRTFGDTPQIAVSRLELGSTGPPVIEADPGWALAQGCADPAGGDVALGGHADLAAATSALQRAEGVATLSAVWSDAVPGAALQALAASPDTAGDVCVPYLLASGAIQVFHGSPLAAAATTVATLAPQTGATLVAASAAA